MFPNILSGNDYTNILSDVFDRIETSKIVMRIVFLMTLIMTGITIILYIWEGKMNPEKLSFLYVMLLVAPSVVCGAGILMYYLVRYLVGLVKRK